jgi:hypothetical protein
MKIWRSKKAFWISIISTVLAALTFFALEAKAADKVDTLRFTYKQDPATLSVLVGWELFWGDAAGGPYVKALDIPKPAGTTSTVFQSEGTLTVSGNPGDTVKKYFVIRPIDANGNFPAWSNEVMVDFPIPVVMQPTYEFTVEIITQPQ